MQVIIPTFFIMYSLIIVFHHWNRFSLSLPGAVLGERSKEIAKVIFQHGEDVAYGFFFRAVFEFTQYITAQNDAVLAEAHLGVHSGYNLHIH